MMSQEGRSCGNIRTVINQVASPHPGLPTALTHAAVLVSNAPAFTPPAQEMKRWECWSGCAAVI